MMALPWLKAVEVIRHLLPILGPPVLKALKQRAKPSEPSRVADATAEELLAALRRDLEAMVAQLQQFHVHTVRLEARIRTAIWLSVAAVVVSLLAIGLTVFR